MPLLWVMKGSYLVFLGVSNNRLTCMQGQKHFHCLIICNYFFYLTCSTIPKGYIFPNQEEGLVCGDWSDWSHFHFIMPVMPDKSAFVSAVLLYVQRCPTWMATLFFTTPKAAPSGKE